MKVKTLIKKLEEIDQESDIYITALGLVIRKDVGPAIDVCMDFLYEPATSEKEKPSSK